MSVLVKAKLVNCEPWSVLKMSGVPCPAIASSTASRQKSTARSIDNRQANTRRLNQSSTTAK
ncbi:hypothetical protein D3C83_105350 [compost metagenome]